MLTYSYFQLPQLLVLHLVVLTLFVRKMADLILCVSVTLVSKETDTRAQVRMRHCLRYNEGVKTRTYSKLGFYFTKVKIVWMK